MYPAEGLTSITLKIAQQQALEENPSLKAAAARVEQAEARVRQARSLLFPQIDASYSDSRSRLPESTLDAARAGTRSGIGGSLIGAGASALFGANPFGQNPLFSAGLAVVQGVQSLDALDETLETRQAGIVASYLVFDGFSRRFAIAAARYGEQETQAAFREAQRLLLSAVAQAYYGVQLARENVSIAAADEEFNQRQLHDAQARQRVGAGSVSDVLNFEVQRRAARAALLQSLNDYRRARIALAALIGIEGAGLPEDTVVQELVSETPEEMAPPASRRTLDLCP